MKSSKTKDHQEHVKSELLIAALTVITNTPLEQTRIALMHKIPTVMRSEKAIDYLSEHKCSKCLGSSHPHPLHPHTAPKHIRKKNEAN